MTEEIKLQPPASATERPRFNPIARLRIWWHLLHLRVAARIAGDAGCALLGIDGYRAMVMKLAGLVSYVEASGSLPPVQRTARKTIVATLRGALEDLALAERLGSPRYFRETLGVYVQERRRTMAGRTKRRLARRGQRLPAGLKQVIYRDAVKRLSSE